MEFQIVLNTYATDIFRKQADYDYISARANYRMQLRQQFLWSAQQAIEKYLKAILLFNGFSARYPDLAKKKREYNHNLVALNDKVKTISLLKYKLDRPDEEFIEYLSEQGGANRYLSTSAYSVGDFLLCLDRTVWNVRRYCQYIDDRGIGGTEPVLGRQEKIVESINNPEWKKAPYEFSLSRGEIEKIIKRPINDPARTALMWANFYYGRGKRIPVGYTAFFSSEIPPHEHYPDEIDLEKLKEYIKFKDL